MRARLAWILGPALLGVGVVPSVALQSDEKPATDKPNLTGRWKLDEAKSDDARAKMRAAREGGQQGGYGGHSGEGGGGGGSWGGHRGGGMGGGMHGGGMHGGGTHGGSGSGMSEEDRAAMREAMENVLDPPKLLTVTQGDLDVTLAGDDGRSLRLHADGKKGKDSSGKVERKTWWDGPRLLSEAKAGSGPKITQSWELSADGKQMLETVHLQMPMASKEVVINRQYDSAPPE